MQSKPFLIFTLENGRLLRSTVSTALSIRATRVVQFHPKVIKLVNVDSGRRSNLGRWIRLYGGRGWAPQAHRKCVQIVTKPELCKSPIDIFNVNFYNMVLSIQSKIRLCTLHSVPESEKIVLEGRKLRKFRDLAKMNFNVPIHYTVHCIGGHYGDRLLHPLVVLQIIVTRFEGRVVFCLHPDS